MITRRVSPSYLLVVGLVCGLIAVTLWAMRTTALDRQSILDEGQRIASSEPVREAFAWDIADAYVPHDAQSSPAELNRAYNIARAAVERPEFELAVEAALPAIYDMMVSGTGTEVALDPAVVNSAILATGNAPPDGLRLSVTQDQVPDLHRPLDLALKVSALFGAVALLLVSLAVGFADHRGRQIMRIGRWLITTGVVGIVLFWALPTLALLPLGGWIAVFGILLSTGGWIVVPGLGLVGAGVIIVYLGRSGEADTRRRELAVIPKAANRTRPSTT